MDIQLQFASEFRLSKTELQQLMRALSSTELYTCLELLRPKKHRSDFRASCAMHIRRWLINNQSVASSDIHLASKPLSVKQFEIAKPKWPVMYSIPKDEVVIKDEIEKVDIEPKPVF